MLRIMNLILAVMYCTVFISGCTSAPVRSDYSLDTSQLKEGIHLDKVWFDDGALGTKRYAEVRLSEVRCIGINDQVNLTRVQASEWLRQATTIPGKDPLILQSAGQGESALLELAITELNPGSTLARFWAGELGAGHAWVQVEGKLTDAGSHKLLGYFVDRDRKSGVATLRNSRGKDSGPGLIHDMIEDIGANIRTELNAVLHIQGE